jgi:hypothetical protein
MEEEILNVPDQDLPQRARRLAVNVLLSAVQLHVHVGVDADEAAVVLGCAPLEPDDDVLVDPAPG